MISIGRDQSILYFGESMILSRLEADSLTYGGEFPGRELWERTPEPRRLTLEGYMTASADSEEDCRRELTLKRDLLSWITAPDGNFFVNIDGRIAHLSAGELIFKREAPFSGESAEHFTLRATIVGGYFSSAPITVSAEEEVDGFSFPLTGDLVTGVRNGMSVIRVNNRGDIPVGFTAEFSPSSTVSIFTLECTDTGKSVTVARDFGSGDTIRVSTLRDNLYLQLIRGGYTYNLTGSAGGGSELFLLPRGESVLYVGLGCPFEGSLTFTQSFVSF